MSDIGDLLKKALEEDEPYRTEEGRRDLDQALKAFESKHRRRRFLAGFVVTTIHAAVFFALYTHHEKIAKEIQESHINAEAVLGDVLKKTMHNKR